jgi:hypothetical protein
MHFFYCFSYVFSGVHAAIEDYDDILCWNLYILKAFADAVDDI